MPAARSRRQHKLETAGAAAAAAFLILAVAYAASQAWSGRGAAPADAFRDGARAGVRVIAQEDVVASSLEELAALSDAVVAGEVIDVRPGRTIADDEDVEGSITFNEVTLRVDEVLSGTLPSPTVVLEQDGMSAGVAIEFVNEMPVLALGDEGVFFLHRKTDAEADGAYRLVNDSQSRLVPGDPVTELSLVDDIGTVDLATLKTRVATATG